MFIRYNKSLEYAQLVLGGKIEHYLSLGCDHGRLEVQPPINYSLYNSFRIYQRFIITPTPPTSAMRIPATTVRRTFWLKAYHKKLVSAQSISKIPMINMLTDMTAVRIFLMLHSPLYITIIHWEISTHIPMIVNISFVSKHFTAQGAASAIISLQVHPSDWLFVKILSHCTFVTIVIP